MEIVTFYLVLFVCLFVYHAASLVYITIFMYCKYQDCECIKPVFGHKVRILLYITPRSLHQPITSVFVLHPEVEINSPAGQHSEPYTDHWQHFCDFSWSPAKYGMIPYIPMSNVYTVWMFGKITTKHF